MDAKIVLTVDASGAISKVQDFNSALSQLQNTTRTSSGLMGQFDSAIGSLTAGFTISRLAVDAYYKIVRTGEQILKDSIEHALKASASQEALKATLDITGRTIQGNLKHYLDFAHAQMMVTTYSHDEVEAVQALLLQLTNLDQKGLDAATMSQLNIPAKMTGVVVTSVESGGAAEAAGLQRGDVIQEVNHEVVKTLEDYQKASSKLNKDELAVLLLSRQGNNLFVAVNPK